MSQQNELIRHGEATCKAKIAKLETQLEVAEQQTPSDLRELRQIYAMNIIEQLSSDVVKISHDGQTWVEINKLANHNALDQLTETSRIYCRNRYNQQNVISLSKSHSEEKSLKPYQQRKEEIESKEADNKNEILRQVQELRSKIATIRTIKLYELLRLNADCVQNLFENFGEGGELARFLILEGHLDDTYYQYITLFHSGRLSPNDNRFLIQIRSFITPEPSFSIDNPKEIIAAMRDEDFRQSYILNVKLVDCLMNNRDSYAEQTEKLFEFISSEFETCESFFDTYYTSGQHIATLLTGLAKAWRGLVPAAIASSINICHVNQLVASLPETTLKALARDFEELPEFVSTNLPEILVNSPQLEPKRLEWLNFEVKNLAAIKEHSEIVHFVFEKGLFGLTIPNLEYIYQAILGKHDLKQLRERNFTTIISLNNTVLMNRIERDFKSYLNDVLLDLQENLKENAQAILAVISHDTLNKDELWEFLARQTIPLPTLERVPERLHSMLFKLGMVEPTWTNCLDFIESGGFENESLVGYLDREVVRATILKHTIPSDSDSLKLRQLLFNAVSLSDVSYKEYVRALPKAFREFPAEIEPAKLRILITERKITFSTKNLEALTNDRDLQLLFVAENIDTYLTDSDSFALDEDFLEDLLRHGTDNPTKLRIIELMDLEVLADLPERSELVGSILANSDAKISDINGSIVQSLIRHSTHTTTKILLLNKYYSVLTNHEVCHILDNLPKPFSEIKIGHNTPKLKITPENLDLVRWLDSRNIISSWSKSNLLNEEIRVNLYRRQ